MKVAISASGEHFDSPVESSFESAKYFIIVDPDSSLSENYGLLRNPRVNTLEPSGVLTAQMLINNGIDCLITGSCDPSAIRIFQAARIPVFGVKDSSVRKIAEQIRNNHYPGNELTGIVNPKLIKSDK